MAVGNFEEYLGKLLEDSGAWPAAVAEEALGEEATEAAEAEDPDESSVGGSTKGFDPAVDV
eukprot:6287693-Lingulodinium_polyedra.AAC.1